ncbi:hypothetical protein ATO67_09495 [Agrobacterium bohemicum]|uniref:Uncharacterized protein n=1 Tax=Agrobacterium bohemicum TaxID=2052828 RepID=A0A135P0B3_9HYPH|nr:hypothetical protein ATO67_09495 [Agrobacterium bohemicum]
MEKTPCRIALGQKVQSCLKGSWQTDGWFGNKKLKQFHEAKGDRGVQPLTKVLNTEGDLPPILFILQAT